MYGKFPIGAACNHTNGKIYLFNGERYTRYTPNVGADAGYPKLISDRWKNFPESFTDGINAALLYNNDKIYMFKDDQYLRYTPGKGVDAGYPKNIADNWTSWDPEFKSGIDAALMSSNGKAYFFKGDKYIRCTPGKGMDDEYPKSIEGNWKKWPSNFCSGVDAAIMHSNGKAYFFKGTDNIRYTLGKGVDDGYPMPIDKNWKSMGGKYVCREEMMEIINTQLAGKLLPNYRLYFGDFNCYCPPLNDVKKILKKSTVNMKKWTEHIFDCDDFAFVLKSDFCIDNYRNKERRVPYCFGIIWGKHIPGDHAMNWVIADDLKLYLVEPQDDSIRLPSGTDYDIYLLIS